jgi:hypothetical protein
MRFFWRTLQNVGSRKLGSPRHVALSIVIAAVSLSVVTSESSAQGMRHRGPKGAKGAAGETPDTPAAEKPPGAPLTKTQTLFSLIMGLTVNPSDAARDTLQQIIEGKISFGAHDKQAVQTAITGLAMRPGSDGGALVLKIAAEPDTQLRPNDKTYPAAAVRYDAVRILGRIGSPEIRLDLAKLHDLTTPEIRTAIEAALMKPSPANFAAQVVLVRSRLLPETMRYDLQKLILEQNTAALKQGLKLTGETPSVAAAGLAPAALVALLQKIAASGGTGDANPLAALQALPAVPTAPGGQSGLPPAGLQGAPSRAVAAEALQNPVALVLEFTEKVFNGVPIDPGTVAHQLWQGAFVETLPPKLMKGPNGDQVLAAVGSIPVKAARERLRDYLEDKSPSELGKLEAAIPKLAPVQHDKPADTPKRGRKSGGIGAGGIGNGAAQGGMGQAGLGQPGMGQNGLNPGMQQGGMGQPGMGMNQGGIPQNGVPQNGMPQNGMPQGSTVPGMVQLPGGALVPSSSIPGATLPGGIPLGGFGNNNNGNMQQNGQQQNGQNGMGQNGMGQNGMGQGMAQNGNGQGGFGGFGAGGMQNGTGNGLGNGAPASGGKGPGGGGMGRLGGTGRQAQPAASQGPVYAIGKDWLDPGAVVALKLLTYKDRPKKYHPPTPPGAGQQGRRSPAAEKRAEEAAEKLRQTDMQYLWRDTIARFVSHWDDRLAEVAQAPAEGAADSETSDAPAKADSAKSKTGAGAASTKSKSAEAKVSHPPKSKGAAPTASVAIPFLLRQGEHITKEFHLRWPEDLPASLTSAVSEPLVVHYIALEGSDELNRTATFYRSCLSKGSHTHTKSETHELDEGKWVDIMQRDPGAHRLRSVDILIRRQAPDPEVKHPKTEELSIQILMVEVESFGPEPKSTEKEKEQAKSDTP